MEEEPAPEDVSPALPPLADIITGDAPEAPPEGETPAEDAPVEEPEKPPEVTEESSSPKKPRVQIDPFASVEELLQNPFCMTSLPQIPEGPGTYKPMLYTFRVKSKRTWNLDKIYAKPPPFYVLVDHTIAVVWTLFDKSADKSKLGISQLQWALHFLKTLYSSDGVHPRDVDFCISLIENYLINEYARLSEFAVVYKTEKPPSPRNLFAGVMTDDMLEKPKPFSRTYTEMMKKCPAKLPMMTDVFDDYIMDMDLLVEMQKLKKSMGMDNIDLTEAVSKDQAIDVLQSWKKEQIDKIQGEVERLRTVEDMMRNVEPKKFQGFTGAQDLEPFFKEK